MWQLALAGVIATLVLAAPIRAEVTKEPFGKTADGTAVERFTLKNKNGMTVKLMTLGATVTEINVPDKDGKFANVAFGFDDVKGYQSKDNQYFGCTTGRVANRIARGTFKLDGKEYKLALNAGKNHLHGGAKRSLDKVVWKSFADPRSKNDKDPDKAVDRVWFYYNSPDGEEGYPGTIEIAVQYSLNDKNELAIHYDVKARDKASPVNLTNHTYFNLAGAGAATALDHELMIPAEKYAVTDNELIPTGKIASVMGTVFDFTKPTRIGTRIEKLYDTGAKGYDLYYILEARKKAGKDAGKGDAELPIAAVLRDPASGRVLTVKTNEPGIQFYTGNFLFGQKGAGGKEYKLRSGICLETMGYPDAVNQPSFPSCILRPGNEYHTTCIYAFSTVK